MKLAIVGSRTFNDYNLLVNFIEKHYNPSEIDTIISGAARGTDTLGRLYAKDNGYQLIEFPANWKKYGRRAGFMRNVDIIKNCDECVCFWDGKSQGTKHDIELCEQMNKPYKICRFDIINMLKEINNEK